MLKKILKYDLLYIYKVLIVFYTLSLFFAVMTRITTIDNPPLIMLIINKILSGTTIALIINIIINSIMRIWVRFKNNIYGDESYLTHTLPVKKENIYLSKILAILITMLTSMLIIGLTLFIACYSKTTIEVIKNSLNIIAQTYNSAIIILLITILLVLTVELLTIVFSGITGIIIGHKKNNNKIIHSIIFGLITYIISQVLVLIITYLIALINPNIMEIFKTNQITNISTIKTFIYIALVIYTFILITLNILNMKLLKKGVNVE